MKTFVESLLWFNPGQQLSTTQLLPQWDERIGKVKVRKVWVEKNNLKTKIRIINWNEKENNRKR